MVAPTGSCTFIVIFQKFLSRKTSLFERSTIIPIVPYVIRTLKTSTFLVHEPWIPLYPCTFCSLLSTLTLCTDQICISYDVYCTYTMYLIYCYEIAFSSCLLESLKIKFQSNHIQTIKTLNIYISMNTSYPRFLIKYKFTCIYNEWRVLT